LYEIQIHQAVLIVIEPGDAGAHRFQVKFLFGLRGVLKERDPGGFANVGEANGDKPVRLLDGLSRERREPNGRTNESPEREKCDALDSETEILAIHRKVSQRKMAQIAKRTLSRRRTALQQKEFLVGPEIFTVFAF
jgi:hypothetical protein